MPPAAEARDHAERLADFIAAAPSSYHTAAEVVRRLAGAGFTLLDETEAWPEQPGGRFMVRRDGAVAAWVVPRSAGPATPVHVLGAHGDSPALKLKPKPTTGSAGWLQAGVEVYGGALLNSWLDRELRVAGRLVLDDGSVHLAATGALLRLPQLAIHLDRQVNEGLKLERQRHMQPVWGLGEPAQADLLGAVAAAGGVDASRIRGYDLVTADAQRGRIFGGDDVFFAAGRLDDLAGVFAGLTGLLRAAGDADGPHIAFLAVFDHEEVGSASRSGAAGPFLADLLERLQARLGADRAERLRALAGSWCLSSDVGHAVHPNYPDKHDPTVRPSLGGGPILKINASQRYATDAVGAAAWASWCASAGVRSQEFVSHNAVPCGSTIGPITATRLGIRTVDAGIPILSMHSVRELADVTDLWDLARVSEAFLRR